MNILLGVTGSVAAVKVTKLYEALSKIGEVKIVITKSAEYFVPPETSSVFPHWFEYYRDSDEWSKEFKLGDDILHIELRKWADCLVIAPLSANTMAKISYGLCDNLLTCVYRAWDFKKPVIVAPAMNTYMWDNPITIDHLNALWKCGVIVVNPISKTLACGDVGVGAMEHADKIADVVRDVVRWKPPIRSLDVMVPVGNHPGAFGAVRKFDVHTGVDLYTVDGANVYAVEDGTVVGRRWFTGERVDMPWWEDTEAIAVEGISGVVLYGEVVPRVNVGDEVRAGDIIANVKRVLSADKYRADIPNHSTSMLHIELYKHAYRGEWAVWNKGEGKPGNLYDPTPFLTNAAVCWNSKPYYGTIDMKVSDHD